MHIKEKALKIIKILDKEYPDTKPFLNFTNPLELVVATVLSAQSTDAQINKLTSELFKKYKKASDYAKAKPSELEKDIRSSGFYKKYLTQRRRERRDLFSFSRSGEFSIEKNHSAFQAYNPLFWVQCCSVAKDLACSNELLK